MACSIKTHGRAHDMDMGRSTEEPTMFELAGLAVLAAWMVALVVMVQTTDTETRQREERLP